MIIDLSGKRAVVTGSTSGIGFAIVRGLAGAGASVVINGRSPGTVKAARQRLEKEVPGCSVDGIAADLASAEGVADVVRRVGEADILVNNLGIFEPAPFEAITDADWQRYFDTNVMSGVRLSRHYLPAMLARGWGRVVFISSESALNIPVEMIHYGMTKTAQLAISRGPCRIRRRYRRYRERGGPRPDTVGGRGGFLRQAGQGAGMSEEEMEAQFIALNRPTSLLRRLATPEEVANMVVYVCSPQASATTGAALRVDGGVVRSIA